MTTQLEDHGSHWIVKTLDGGGKRKRMGRYAVRVDKGDPAALRQEVLKQAVAARERAGIVQPPQEPVV